MENLLREVVKENLEKIHNGELSKEEEKQTLKDTMELTDRLIVLEKAKVSEQYENEKLHLERAKFANSVEESNKAKILKAIEIGVPIVLTGVNFLMNVYFMKALCNFEKENNFTTGAGKGLVRLFSPKR